eukprot:s351_g16.t1
MRLAISRNSSDQVAQAARCAFRSAFSEEKRRGVFRHSLRECLELLRSNLKHSEQSLHDELGILQQPSADKDNALERQDRYARVVASSLNALGELVQVCSSPMAPDQPGGNLTWYRRRGYLLMKPWDLNPCKLGDNSRY